MLERPVLEYAFTDRRSPLLLVVVPFHDPDAIDSLDEDVEFKFPSTTVITTSGSG